MKKNLQLLLMCMLMIAQTVWAQSNRTISGTVKDVTGKPIAGATVGVKGTERATATNDDGAFSIEVSGNNAVLFITSCIVR